MATEAAQRPLAVHQVVTIGPSAVARHLEPIGDCINMQVITCLCPQADEPIFKALADRTRRAILDELSERDAQTLFELCARLATRHQLGSTRQAISQHLDVLEGAGLVRSRRNGRYKFHYIQKAPLARLAERWLEPGRSEGI